MASASPISLLPAQDRGLVERPETRSAEGTDGQFAGLMAQITAKPAVNRASDPSPVRPSGIQKERPGKVATPKAATLAPKPAASDEPRTRAASPATRTAARQPRVDAQDSKVDTLDPNPDLPLAEATDPSVDSPEVKAAVQAPGPLDSETQAAGLTAAQPPVAASPEPASTLLAALPLSPTVLPSAPPVPEENPSIADLGTRAPAGQAADGTPAPKGKDDAGAPTPIGRNDASAPAPIGKNDAGPADPTGRPEAEMTLSEDPTDSSTPAPKTQPGPAPAPANVVLPGQEPTAAPRDRVPVADPIMPRLRAAPAESRPTQPPAGSAPEPEKRTEPSLASPSTELLLKVASPTLNQPAPVTPPAEAQDPPLTDPGQVPPAALAKAILAEPDPRVKEGTRAGDQPPVAATPRTDQPLPGKPVRAMDLQQPPREPIQGVSRPLQALAPAMPEQEVTPASGKAAAANLQNPEAVVQLPETGPAKSSPMPQSSLSRAADGSAMAALGALARPAESVAAQASAQAPVPVPVRTPPVTQVEGGLRWMLKGGVQEAQLQLHPDSLGQVTIHLRVEGGEVHARLWITEHGSMQAVQEGRPHLEMSLKEQGLSLGSFDLQQGNRPHQEAPSAPAPREHPVPEAPLARQEPPAAIYPTSANPHHVELYA